MVVGFRVVMNPGGAWFCFDSGHGGWMGVGSGEWGRGREGGEDRVVVRMMGRERETGIRERAKAGE